MTKKAKPNIAALVDDEGRAMEAADDAPIPTTSITRGRGRTKTLQVRLNPDEFDELERIAATRGLPVSTIAREAIMRMVQPDASRSAAASRVIDEFVNYVDALGASRVAGRASAGPGVSGDPIDLSDEWSTVPPS